MRSEPLPPELNNKWGNLPDLTFRGAGEWSSACPHCGGAETSRRDKSDRFRLFAGDNQYNPRVWCRNCGHFEWADQDGEPPSKEQLAAAKKERTRLAETNRKRVRQKIVDLQAASYWQGWHDAMSSEHRRLWHKEGIIEWAIDQYKLGYCPEYKLSNGHTTPTMTIPHWGPDWELINIQHRLLEPPAPGDKYRQMAGLPAAMFLTEPDEDVKGPAIIVEGAKKAIVTYQRLGNTKYLIIGIPSKTPSAKMLDDLKNCEPIYLMLDPDAYFNSKGAPAVNRIARKLGRERVKVVKLPVKPDDFFVVYGGRSEQMKPYIKQAVQA
jgi:hypothetical protein